MENSEEENEGKYFNIQQRVTLVEKFIFLNRFCCLCFIHSKKPKRIVENVCVYVWVLGWICFNFNFPFSKVSVGAEAVGKVWHAKLFMQFTSPRKSFVFW